MTLSRCARVSLTAAAIHKRTRRIVVPAGHPRLSGGSMLFRHVGLVFLVVAALFIRVPAIWGAPPRAPQKTDDARRALQSAYDAMNAYLARKDLNRFFAFRTADYGYISPQGRRSSRTEVRQDFEGGLSLASAVRAHSKIVGLSVRAGVASVRVRSRVAMIWSNPRTGREETLAIEEEASDTWVQRHGRWLLKHTRAIQRRTSVDGRPEPT